MNKYIRTKDGIYELKENGIGQTLKEVQIALMTNDYKQSDNLAELCDEFMIYCPIDNSKTLYKSLYTLEKGLNKRIFLFIKDNLIIYGCIWTDKGLIYVAKMNKTGEFVLI